ncbi:MAG: hypothetical protein ACFFBX_00105 [Promethearchaeota archaeon]
MGKAAKIAGAIVAIVIISAGIYLGLAYPFPIQSQAINLSGIISQTDITGVVGWPNSQIQVTITLTSVTAIWGYEIRDASNNLIDGLGSIDITTTRVDSPWLDLSGSYTITVTCALGELEGTVTVYARGVPFITA